LTEINQSSSVVGHCWCSD